jgi:hypothetical protein
MALHDVIKGFVDKWMLPNCTKKIKDGLRFFQQAWSIDDYCRLWDSKACEDGAQTGEGMSGVGTRSVTSYLFSQLAGH